MAAEDYTGPVGHEKKFHKTHFSAPDVKLKTTQDNGYEWIYVGVGKYRRVKKDVKNAKKKTNGR